MPLEAPSITYLEPLAGDPLYQPPQASEWPTEAPEANSGLQRQLLV